MDNTLLYIMLTQITDMSNLGGTSAHVSVNKTVMGGTNLGPLQGSFTRTTHTTPQVGLGVSNRDCDKVGLHAYCYLTCSGGHPGS